MANNNEYKFPLEQEKAILRLIAAFDKASSDALTAAFAQADADNAALIKPYAVYVMAGNQTGTDKPSDTVLENEIGLTAPVWARTSSGVYTITLAGAFGSAANKLAIFATTQVANRRLVVERTSVDVLTVTSYDYAGAVKELGGRFSLEVRVYP